MIIQPEGQGFTEHKFYGGTETCLFDRENWTWFWKRPEGLIKLDGVSSVVKVCTPIQPIKIWAVRLATEKTKQLLMSGGYVGQDAYVLSEQILDDILERAKKEDTEQLEDAGKVGHDAHEHIEKIIKAKLTRDNSLELSLLANPPFDLRAGHAVHGAMRWMRDHNVIWISTERPCFSRKMRVAGTSDGLCWVSSCNDRVCCPTPFVRRLSLADWKTSNALRIGYLWQAACYRACIEEEDGIEIEDTWVIRLDKETGEVDPWHIEGRESFEQDLFGYQNALATVRSMVIADNKVRDIKMIRKIAKAEARAITRAAEYAIKCPKAEDYKGQRLSKCLPDGSQCLACKSKYEENHNGKDTN